MKLDKAERATIRDYEQIRKMLRLLFVYECYSPKELQRILGISEKTYKNTLAIIRKYLGSEVITVKKRKHTNIVNFSSEMFETNWNVLMDSYTSKAFRRGNVDTALLYLQILNAHRLRGEEKGFDVREIEQEADQVKEDCISDLRTAKKIFANLTALGYLRLDETSKYQIAPDILEGFSLEAKKRLLTAIDFFSNIHYPAICGKYCFDTLYSIIQQEDTAVYETPFLMKNNHFAHVLDDEVLFDLLEAIHQNKKVKFVYLNQYGKVDQIDQAIAVHIVADEFLGRRYLVAQTEKKTLRLYRLDRISKLAVDKQHSIAAGEKGAEVWNEKLKYSLYGTQVSTEPPKKVKLRLKDNDIRGVVHRLFCVEEEVTEENGDFVVTILVDFPLELKPWLRQYMHKVQLLACEGIDLVQEMEQELMEWRKIYGIVP